MIYEQPANLFVASFIGSPPINIFKCTKDGLSFHFDEFNHTIPVDKLNDVFFPDIGSGNLPDGKYELGIRPEDFLVNVNEDDRLMMGKVFFVENLGADYFLHTKVGSKTIVVRNPQDKQLSMEDADLNLAFRKGKVHLFDGENHTRVQLR